MRQLSVPELTELVSRISAVSAFGPRLRGVLVEPADDGVGGDFLRVSLRLNDHRDMTRATVKPLVRRIQDAVYEVDDRIASVRFPDP